MAKYLRENPLFSACGLNCGLCSMRLSGHCTGCGGSVDNHSCAILKCGAEHGVEYCFMCKEFPCSRFDGATEYDSFVTRRNMLNDLEKAKTVGIEKYMKEQEEKAKILEWLISNYNDGRKKTFFGVAVNLLELQDIKAVVEKLKVQTTAEQTDKEKAALAKKLFAEIAKEQGIALKLNKKPAKS